MLREMLTQDMQTTFANTAHPVYVAASGGVDSSCLAVALLSTELQPIITSFTLDDRESEDFRAARKLAKHFALDFVPIHVPTDPEFIRKSVLRNMQNYKLVKKADIECMYPFIYMIEKLGEMDVRYLASGMWADDPFP